MDGLIILLDVISYSPLKISFAGEGSDIPPFVNRYGGASLNSTIDLGLSIRYRKDDMPLEVFSKDSGRSSFSRLNKNDHKTLTQKILKLESDLGIKTGRMIITSDLPSGSGLGSSSALAVAAIKLADFIMRWNLVEMEIASKALTAEGEIFENTPGKHDPFAVAFGGPKLTIFEKDGSVKVIRDVERRILDQLSQRILLVHSRGGKTGTGIPVGSAGKSKPSEMKTGYLLGQQRDLAITMWDYIRAGDINGFLEGINLSWDIGLNLSGNTSSPEIKRVFSTAFKNGAAAAKKLGMGPGGFILVIAGEKNAESLIKALSRVSRYVIRAAFDYSGARIY